MTFQKNAIVKTSFKRKTSITTFKLKIKKAKINSQTKTNQQLNVDDKTDNKIEIVVFRQFFDKEITKHKKVIIIYFKSEDITKVNII